MHGFVRREATKKVRGIRGFEEERRRKRKIYEYKGMYLEKTNFEFRRGGNLEIGGMHLEVLCRQLHVDYTNPSPFLLIEFKVATKGIELR